MLGDRLLRLAHHLFILLLVVVSTLVLSAQVVVDPHFVEFNASPDHDTLFTDGRPLVSSYSMSIYTSGGSTPIDTINLGKPTPVSGIIRVDFIPLLHAAPPTGVNLEARVLAVGPGGTTPSSTSTGFTFQAPGRPG